MRTRQALPGIALFIVLSACPCAHAQPYEADEPESQPASDARTELGSGEQFAAEESEREREAEDVQARAEYRRRQRLGPDGRIPSSALVWAKAQLRAKGRSAGELEPQDAGIWSWEWLGPGNIGGRLRAILIHPTNPNLMWLGTAGGGIWRTTNAGASWFPVSDFIPALSAVTLAMDPTNSQVMYAGTGELVGSNSSIPGAGIFKSLDAGATWTQLPTTANDDFDYVSRIAHHPTNANELLAATATGVYRSVTGGVLWTRILTPSFGEPVRDVKYHPTTPTIVGAGSATDFYLSTNGGTSWHRQTTGGPQKMAASPGRCEIAFTPANPQMIVVSAGSDVPIINDLTDTIWRSLDQGATWSAWLSTNADAWSSTIWVSPTDANVAVWGGFGDLYRTNDGGQTVVRISNWPDYVAGTSAHGDQHVIVPSPGYNGTTNTTVFVGNDGGIQRASAIKTVAQTSGWTNLANGLGVSQFFGGAAATDGSVILGGTQDNGVLVYHPAGGTGGWTAPLGGDGTFAAVDYTNPSRVFAGTAWLGVFRSDNGGQSFVQKTFGLGDSGINTLAGFLAPLVMDPNTPNILIGGGSRLWRTINAGDSWFLLRNSLPSNSFCSAIDISKSSPLVIWVGYENGVVSYTTDGGSSWTDRTLPVGGRFVTDIAVNPFAANEVVVTVGGYATDTIWLTNNYGATWQQRTGTAPHDLPPIQVNTVRYHPLQPNWIYVGTDAGVFASEDKGITWRITPAYGGNDGPNNAEVDELFWQGTSYLIAATHGRGMYRCKPLPIVYVDLVYAGPEDGTEFRPYNTVTEALATYGAGALVSIRTGTYTEAALTIDKRGRLRATSGSVIIH